MQRIEDVGPVDRDQGHSALLFVGDEVQTTNRHARAHGKSGLMAAYVITLPSWTLLKKTGCSRTEARPNVLAPTNRAFPKTVSHSPSRRVWASFAVSSTVPAFSIACFRTPGTPYIRTGPGSNCVSP